MLEKGMDEASMDNIAVRAGTTKPTVYAHFKSNCSPPSSSSSRRSSSARCAALRTTPPSRSRPSPSSVVVLWSWSAGGTPSAISV
jgi:hypothetical protein